MVSEIGFEFNACSSTNIIVLPTLSTSWRLAKTARRSGVISSGVPVQSYCVVFVARYFVQAGSSHACCRLPHIKLTLTYFHAAFFRLCWTHFSDASWHTVFPVVARRGSRRRARRTNSGAVRCLSHGVVDFASVAVDRLKPDALERRLVGQILARFEARGLSLVGLKICLPTRSVAEAHMHDHRHRDYFEQVCQFLCSRPLVCVAIEGCGAVRAVRSLIGDSFEPLHCVAGTIRGDLSLHWPRNLVHGSDSLEAAQRELDVWFPGGDGIVPPPASLSPRIYELPDDRVY